jgi:hypothetical protein
VKPIARLLAAAVFVVGSGASTPADNVAGRVARRRPIHDAIDRVVEQVVLSHLGPCALASRDGIPCFPSGIEQEGPRFSVAEALRRYRGIGSPAPGAPTVSEIQGRMSGAMQSASGGVSTDLVCDVKSLWKKIRGNGTTFHLYRTWDERGERPLLTDHLLDAEDYQTNLQFHFEYLGQFDGECAAVAAWRKALREAVAPKPAPEAEPPPETER